MATDIKIDVMELGAVLPGDQIADAGDILLTFGGKVYLPMSPAEAIELGKQLIRLGHVGRRQHKKEWSE